MSGKNKKEIRLTLSYDDVLLVPHYSDTASRKEIDLKTKFSKRILLNIPIVSANMDTVTGSEMAICMAREGGIGIIHRFNSIEEESLEVKRVKNSKIREEDVLSAKDKTGRLLVGAAIGVKDGLERAKALVDAGVDALVIDIAHGHHFKCIELTKLLKKKFKNIDIVAGNVATAEGTLDLIKAGADAIKVGIGPGAACSTRIVAGSGVPQLTAVMDCVEVSLKYKIPIIADGGIKNSGDLAKAIGAGASTVMIGNLLSGSKESPGEYFMDSGSPFKIYRGLASRDASMDRANKEGNKERSERAPEGIGFRVSYKGEVKRIISELIDGLQSGMSYTGAKSIKEFWEKSEFVRITDAGLRESMPRSHQV